MKKICARFLSVMLLIGALTACVKNNIDSPNDQKISEVSIPDDFDWLSVKTTELTVIPADAYDGAYYYVIEVFGSNPTLSDSASLLAKGVANVGMSYITNLVLPTAADMVYVRQTSPTKGQIIQSVPVSESSLVCDFNASGGTALTPKSMPEMPSVLKEAKVVVDDPTPSGATELNSKSKDVAWTSNKNFVIKEGETFSGNVVLGNNAALYVEGSYKLSGNKMFTMGSGSKLVVQSTGKVQISSSKDFQYDAGTTIKNFGNFVATNGIAITNNALVYNYGTLDVVKFSATNTAQIYNNGTFSSNNAVELTSAAKLYNYEKVDFNKFTTTNSYCTVLNTGDFMGKDVYLSSAPFTNQGTVTVSNTLEMASSCSFSNAGSVETKNLITNSGTKIYNNCHFLATKTGTVTGTTVYQYDGSLMSIESLISDGSTFEMDGSAILESEDAAFTTWKNYIIGSGSAYALARLKNIVPDKPKEKSSNITFKGKVEIECTSCTENTAYSKFYVVDGSEVRWAKTGESTTSISSTSCNDGGNAGSSGGGGSDPSDPDFPIVVNLTTNYSFIMEDNWPLLGDYDLNDVVVDLSISYLQDKDNKATKMMVAYKLRAAGATKRIAAAFRLDELLSPEVSSVSYSTPILTGSVFKTEKGGLETDQTWAVIPLFDDAHNFLSGGLANGMLNTIIGEKYYTPKTDTVTVAFASPIDPSKIAVTKLNFFIVTDGSASQASRTEIHLSGYEPTGKVDGTLFGTADDASTEGVKYRSKNNLIWGLLIPTSFNYASEWKDITSVYPEFAGWCTSSGTENTEWYKNPTDKAGYVYK